MFLLYLVEPRALQDEHAGTEQLQNDVVLYENLQHGTDRSSKHRHQQHGVDVSVQWRPPVQVEVKEKPWRVEKKVFKIKHPSELDNK